MKINSTVASEALNLNGEAVAKVDHHFGEGTAFSFSMGYHWHHPYLSLELSGEVCNPLLHGGEADEWNSILLSKLGFVPRYTYKREKTASIWHWKSPIATLR